MTVYEHTDIEGDRILDIQKKTEELPWHTIVIVAIVTSQNQRFVYGRPIGPTKNEFSIVFASSQLEILLD